MSMGDWGESAADAKLLDGIRTTENGVISA